MCNPYFLAAPCFVFTNLYRTATAFNEGSNAQNNHRPNESRQDLIEYAAIPAKDPSANKTPDNTEQNFGE